MRGLGNPVRLVLTGGQAGDAPRGQALLNGLAAQYVMADAAYDSDRLRAQIHDLGAVAVIPNNASRSLKHPIDTDIYKERHLVECCFSRLKQFRRVATRYEKTERNYLAVITAAAIVLWLR